MSNNSNLIFNVDSKEFEDVAHQFRKDLQKELNEAVKNLADMTLEKTLEFAQEGLRTTFSIYKENLTSRSESGGIYIVALDQKALWIEEGLPADFDMKPGLLKNGKVSKKTGHRYAVVPFKHDKGPSQNTPKAQDLVNQVKGVLKEMGVPFGKIEKHANGSPRLGLLHKVDIDVTRPETKGTQNALQGLRVYQKQEKDAQGNVKRNRKGEAVVSKSIMTFRTVTDGPAGSGKFIHPGMEAKKYMDKAFDWAMEKFDREILPELLKKWGEK